MKTPLKILGLFALLTSVGQVALAQTGIVVCDLTTGKNNTTGVPIPYGTYDDTWTVSSLGITNALPRVVTNLGGAWAVNECGRWITPFVYRDTPGEANPSTSIGVYTYKTTFNMTSHCFPWAQIRFAYIGGDNNVTGLTINGHAYTLNPATANDYNPLTANVTIVLDPSHIVIGTNTVAITVNNTESYTGFYACGNVTVGYCTRSGNSKNGAFMGGEDMPDPVQVLPNPSTGKFSVTLQEPAAGSIAIMDMTGRMVQQLDTREAIATYPVDMSTLPKGIYSISVRTGQTVQTTKIVLQ